MDYQLPDPCITISGKVPKIGKFPEKPTSGNFPNQAIAIKEAK